MDGQVRDVDGKPVPNAIVDVWHANTLGGYSFFDPSQPKYNLRRRIETDAEGRYRFRSLLPSGYACPPDGVTQALLTRLGRHGHRPAHIHFFVTAPGYRKLTTQINIDGDEYLHDDFAFATRDGLIPEVVRIADAAAVHAKRPQRPRSPRSLRLRPARERDAVPATVVNAPTRRPAEHPAARPRRAAILPRPDWNPADARQRHHHPGRPARDLAIDSIRSTIVDVPTVRRHKLSQTSVTAQSYVVVELRLANGATGIGEAATLGGPRWSEESVEAIKANIDAYLAPR